MYSDVFCRIYNLLGWNAYPEAFGAQLLDWLARKQLSVRTSLDLACGTGVLCRVLQNGGIHAAGMDFSPGMIDIARQQSPEIPFAVADMTTYCPAQQFDLVTCTGDSINHLPREADVEALIRNAAQYTAPGGYFIFDVLDEKEISDSEPFEFDFDENTHVTFRMTRPAPEQVQLDILVEEAGKDSFREIIRERLYDPKWICSLLEKYGFRQTECGHRLPDSDYRPVATWYITAKR